MHLLDSRCSWQPRVVNAWRFRSPAPLVSQPRKGYFEVTVKGKPVISLASMPRPFKKLRGTDLEDVAKTVLQAL